MPAGAITFRWERRKPTRVLSDEHMDLVRTGNSPYNALQVDVNRRFSHGFSVRGVYTWSKALDDGDSLNQTTAKNAPGLVSNPYNLRADWGPATYDVSNLGVISAIYDLPFGQGKTYLADASGVTGKLVSGWGVTSIVTLQSGFPFTPQLSYNPSNNGDTRNPVRPFLNPDFSGPVILGKPPSGSIPRHSSRRQPLSDFMETWAETNTPDRGLPLGIFRC